MSRALSLSQDVVIRIETLSLNGQLSIPQAERGLVLFAHGSGSSRFSPRNQQVAEHLQQAGFATLLFDLLTPYEETIDQAMLNHRFDIELLSNRLSGATAWALRQEETRRLPIGYFGASTGAAAALVAAAQHQGAVRAVVSRGGRPDLAGRYLAYVSAPTLLIVGGDDLPVIDLNQRAFDDLAAPIKAMDIVPEAGHLFEEPGKLEIVADLAANWFRQYLHN